MIKIFKNEEIECIVESRLMEYEKRHGKIPGPCVPIDNIIEDCDLSILYEKIKERQGEKILGGLNIKEKIIVINETYISLFKDKPGLEPSTKAHELGHWDVFVDKNNDSTDFLFDSHQNLQGVEYRNTESGGRISILVNAWTDNDIYQAYKIISSRKDHPNVASAVDRYANSILLPKDIVLSCIREIDITVWKDLYKIAETLGVTISALCVRLTRLGLIYIKDKKIFRTKEEAIGQNTFKFN